MNDIGLAAAPGGDAYKAIFDAMRDGILVADAETGEFVYANSAICRMLGYTETEMLGLTPGDIQSREPAGFAGARFAALAAREIDAVNGLPTLRKDATTFLSAIAESPATIGGRDCLIRVFRDVTRERAAEATMREREARLRRAESMVRLGHFSLDGSGDNFVCSDGMKEIWGFDRDSMPSFADCIARLHPEDAERVMAEFDRFMHERRGFRLEYRIVRPDGSTTELTSHGEVGVEGPNGEPRWFGTLLDITERKRTEGALAESEERLRFVIEATNDGIWDWNLVTHEVYLSPRWKEIAGYADDELPSAESSFFGLLHPEDKLRVEEALPRHLAAVAPFRMEFRLRRKDGSYCWVVSHARVIFDASGQPVRMIGAITDITGRKRAEEALRASEDRHRRLHESMADAFVQMDMAGRIVNCNPAYREMVGYTEEELSRMTFMDLTPERWRDFEGRIVAEQVLPLERSEVYEKEYRRKDGSVIPVELRTFLLKDVNGEPAGMWAIVRDISERQRMLTELLIKENAMESAMSGIALARLDETLSYVNEAWLRMHGYERAEEVLGRPLRDRIVETAEVEECIGAIRKAGRWTGEMLRRRRDGTVFPAEIVANMVFDAVGEPICMLASFQDITERKQAEKSLASERDWLRQILDSQFGFTMVCEPDGAIVEVSQIALTLSGFQRADVVGRVFWEVGWLEPGAEPEVQEAIRRAALGETVPVNSQARFPGIGRRDVDSVFGPLRNEKGAVTNVIGFGVDVTERNLAEEHLRENEGRLKEAQEIAQTGSWELNLTEGRLTWSDEAFRIFEIDKDVFAASYGAFLELVHPEDRELVDSVYTRSLETREPYAVTHRLLMPDGRIKYLNERARSDFDAEGRPIRSIGTVQDVTEKRQVEERIHAQLREKEVLLREIHHRVKNNLQIISSLLYLQSAASADPEVVRLFEDSRRRVQAMASVHDILYQSPDMEHVAVGPYIDKLVSALRSTYHRPGQDIQVTAQVSVPYLNLRSAVPCGLIVNELVTNAFKYAFADRERGTVEVRLFEAAPGQLRLSVQDDGRGMTGEMERTTGGFGLRLTQLLAEQLGGSLEVMPGAGTALAVTFPAKG